MALTESTVTEMLALANDALKRNDMTSAEYHINDVIQLTDGKYANEAELATLVQHSHQLASLWQAAAKRSMRQDKLEGTYETLRAACLYRQTVAVAKTALQSILSSPHNRSQWTAAGQTAIRNIKDTVEVASKQLERLQSSLASSIEREVYVNDTSTSLTRHHGSWRQRLPFDKRILVADWLYDFKAYIDKQQQHPEQRTSTWSRTASRASIISDSVFDDMNPVENGYGADANNNNTNTYKQQQQQNSKLPLTNGHSSALALRDNKNVEAANINKLVQDTTKGSSPSPSSSTYNKLRRSQSDRRVLPHNSVHTTATNGVSGVSTRDHAGDPEDGGKIRRSSAAAVLQPRKPSIDLDQLHSNIQSLVRQISADRRRKNVVRSRGRPSESMLRTDIAAGLQRYYLNEEEEEEPNSAIPGTSSTSSSAGGLSWIERLATNDIYSLKDASARRKKSSILDGSSVYDNAVSPPTPINRRKIANVANWPGLLTLASSRKRCSRVIAHLPTTFVQSQRQRRQNTELLRKWSVQSPRLNYERVSPVSTIVSMVRHGDSIGTPDSSLSSMSSSTEDQQALWLEYVAVLQLMAQTMSTAHTDHSSALDLQLAALDCLLHAAKNEMAAHLLHVIDIVSDISMTLYSAGDVSASIATMEDVITLCTHAPHTTATRIRVARAWLWIGQAYLGKDPTHLLDHVLAMVRKVLSRWEITGVPHLTRNNSISSNRGGGSRRSNQFIRRSAGADPIDMAQLLDSDSESDCDSDDNDDDDDEDASDVDGGEEAEYDVSVHEALTAFQHAAAALASIPNEDKMSTGAAGDDQSARLREVQLTVNMFLADCKMLTGDHVLAMDLYKASVSELEKHPAKDLQPVHVHGLIMLATGRFLRHRLSSAATLLERAEHVQLASASSSADCREESGYAAGLLAHVYHLLGQVNKSIAYATKTQDICGSLLSPVNDNITACSRFLRWFVVRTLHLSGRACADLDLHERAAGFLSVCREVLRKSGDDINTALVVAQDLADVCISLNEPSLAVKLYEEATSTYELLGRQSESYASRQLLEDARQKLAETGSSSSKMLASRQNSSSGARRVGEKMVDGVAPAAAVSGEVAVAAGEADKVSVMLRLADTYTLSADWDRAIDYLRQSVDLIEDSNLKCNTLRRLGTLYHVKANAVTLTELRQQCLANARVFYDEAADVANSSSSSMRLAVTVFHAALCFQQERYADALFMLMRVNHVYQSKDDVATLYTYEMSVLPFFSLHAQSISRVSNCQITVNTRLLSKFLTFLCFNRLRLTDEADAQLLAIINHAYRPSTNSRVGNIADSRPSVHSPSQRQLADDSGDGEALFMLGCSLMELAMWREAAAIFHSAAAAAAAALTGNSDDAIYDINARLYCALCVCMHCYGVLCKAFLSIATQC